jgi:hypothetical protein
MEAFHAYGMSLSNCINLPNFVRVFEMKNPPPAELLVLPDKPALPNRVEYTSDPIPLH